MLTTSCSATACAEESVSLAFTGHTEPSAAVSTESDAHEHENCTAVLLQVCFNRFPTADACRPAPPIVPAP